jgi:hypothetical protein
MKQLLLHLDREEHFIICDLDEKKLEAVVGGRSKKTARRLHISWRLLV